MCGTLGIEARAGGGVGGGSGRLDSVEAMLQWYAGRSSAATRRLAISAGFPARPER